MNLVVTIPGSLLQTPLSRLRDMIVAYTPVAEDTPESLPVVDEDKITSDIVECLSAHLYHLLTTQMGLDTTFLVDEYLDGRRLYPQGRDQLLFHIDHTFRAVSPMLVSLVRPAMEHLYASNAHLEELRLYAPQQHTTSRGVYIAELEGKIEPEDIFGCDPLPPRQHSLL